MKRSLPVGLMCLLSVNGMAKTGNQVSSLTTSSLHFVENKGQITDQDHNRRDDIQFRLAGNGLTAFVGNGQLHYQFAKVNRSAATSKHGEKKMEQTATTEFYRVDVALIGANKNASVVAGQPQSYTENYFQGQGKVSAHAYDKITYKNVYPNIDWVVYVKGGKLEYDFVVNAGGNPADIKLQYNGATGLSLNNEGSLIAKTPMGDITEKAPSATDGNGRKVSSSFSLNGNVLGFKTGAYTAPLTIDPAIAWATYYGGTNQESPCTVKSDAVGNVYICGTTLSNDNIATLGAYQVALAGYSNAFLAKFNNTGVLQWATYYGGDGTDGAFGMSLDSGNVYMTGYTDSYTGISTPGAYQTTFGGQDDAFLAKFDSSGALIWGTYFGTYSFDQATAIATDSVGNSYIAGYTYSYNGMATTGAYQIYDDGYKNAFLTKFNSAGNVVWSTYYGGNDETQALGVAVDAAGNVSICGYTEDGNNIATIGAYQTSFGGGGEDGFIASFSNTGAIRWSTYLGGDGFDTEYGITTDVAGNVYAAGSTTSASGIATSGSFQQVYNYGYDGMLSKFNNQGAMQWSTYIGGSSDDNLSSVATDGAGDIFVGGTTSSTNGIATANAFQNTLAGINNGFLVKFSSGGSQVWGTYLGGSYQESLYAVDANDSTVYAALNSLSSGLATTGAYQTLNNGAGDVLLAKIADCPPPTQPGSITGAAIVCGGDTQTYAIAPVAGATYYTWTLPGGWVNTSDSDTVSVITGGTGGTISVTANSACGSSQPQTLTVTNTAVTATITASGTTNICAGSSVTLNNTTTDASYTYQWKLNNTAITGATNTSYQAMQPGSYTIAITNAQNCIGTSNVIAVTIDSVPQNVISLNGDSIICQGSYGIDMYAVYNYNYYYGYQWQLNGVNIPNANYQDYSTSSAGTYTVVVTVPGGCADTSAPVTIQVKPSPAMPTVSNNGPVCQGSPVTLTATNITPGTSYIWTGDNGFVSTDSIAVVNTTQYYYYDYYTFTVTDTDGCTAIANTEVEINSAPDIYEIEGNYNVCYGTSQTYDTYGNGADSYIWTLPNGWTGSSTTDQINLVVGTTSGNITVEGVNSCGTSQPASTYVTVSQGPAVIITQNGTILNAPNNMTSYQWYLNGAPIQGAYGSSYTPTQDGAYYVTAISAFSDCPGQSNTIVINLGVASVQSGTASVSLYPNPNNGSFTLTGNIPTTDSKVNIDVLDVTGRVVLNTKADLNNTAINKQVTLGNDVAAGVYMVRISSATTNDIIEFVKK